MFIIVLFWLASGTPSAFFSYQLYFFPLTHIFLPSSVFLSYFILAVPMHECLGKHSCMRLPFPIAILNGNFFFRVTWWSFRSKGRLEKLITIIIIIIILCGFHIVNVCKNWF